MFDIVKFSVFVAIKLCIVMFYASLFLFRRFIRMRSNNRRWSSSKQ